MSNQDSHDWDNYRALVLDNFDRINKNLEALEENISDLKNNHILHLQLELENLRTKMNLFGKLGVIFISIPGIFLALLQIIKLVK